MAALGGSGSALVVARAAQLLPSTAAIESAKVINEMLMSSKLGIIKIHNSLIRQNDLFPLADECIID